jgi:hypothetical protein
VRTTAARPGGRAYTLLRRIRPLMTRGFSGAGVGSACAVALGSDALGPTGSAASELVRRTQPGRALALPCEATSTKAVNSLQPQRVSAALVRRSTRMYPYSAGGAAASSRSGTSTRASATQAALAAIAMALGINSCGVNRGIRMTYPGNVAWLCWVWQRRSRERCGRADGESVTLQSIFTLHEANQRKLRAFTPFPCFTSCNCEPSREFPDSERRVVARS